MRFERTKYHGGAPNGNDCKKVIKLDRIAQLCEVLGVDVGLHCLMLMSQILKLKDITVGLHCGAQVRAQYSEGGGGTKSTGKSRRRKHKHDLSVAQQVEMMLARYEEKRRVQKASAPKKVGKAGAGGYCLSDLLLPFRHFCQSSSIPCVAMCCSQLICS